VNEAMTTRDVVQMETCAVDAGVRVLPPAQRGLFSFNVSLDFTWFKSD